MRTHWINMQEVADRLGSSYSTIAKKHAAGLMPKASYIGRRPRWEPEAIDEWFRAGGLS